MVRMLPGLWSGDDRWFPLDLKRMFRMFPSNPGQRCCTSWGVRERPEAPTSTKLAPLHFNPITIAKSLIDPNPASSLFLYWIREDPRC